MIWIDEFEILKRRNSRWRKCSTITDNYDSITLEEILLKRGCRPPYISGHMHHPKCDSQDKIRTISNAMGRIWEMRAPNTSIYTKIW